MKFTVAVLTTLSLLGSAAAHMRMVEPEQWKTGPNLQAPLDPNGSDFPCQNAQNEISPEVLNTPTATYTPGGKGTLRVIGGATHGGGSGQMVITYDLPPTANSVWRVLHSWEGSHPVKSEGNTSGDPVEEHPAIDFLIPEGLPSGKATVAWNWFNRVGNREHYMKCATVEVTGGVTSTSAYEGFPTAFRANSNGCTVRENMEAIEFGITDERYVTINSDAKPELVDCAPVSGGKYGSAPTGGNEGAEEEAPATPTAEPTAPTSAPEVPETPETPEHDDNTESGEGADEELPAAPTSTPAAPTSTPAAPTPAPKPKPETGKSTDGSSSDSSSSGGACVEGATVCSDGNTWSQCGSGVLQNMGLVPAGLSCQGGKLVAKRSVRFSAEHRRHRRHI